MVGPGTAVGEPLGWAAAAPQKETLRPFLIADALLRRLLSLLIMSGATAAEVRGSKAAVAAAAV